MQRAHKPVSVQHSQARMVHHHEDRTHPGLAKQTPASRSSSAASGRIGSQPRLGGLHIATIGLPDPDCVLRKPAWVIPILYIYRCERLTRSPAGKILCIAHRAGGSGASGRFPVQFAGRLQAFVSGKSLNLGWMRFGRRTTKPDLTAAGSFDRLGTHTFNTEKGGG